MPAQAKELKEIEITCQYVNWPKEGKRLGSIKTSEGEFFGVDPGMLTRFQQGEVCTVEYTESPKQGGGVWKNIKRKVSSVAPVLQKPPIQYPRPRTNPVDQEQIFCTAHTKETYTRETTALELVEEINKLRQVWRNTFGASEQHRDDEMGDSIPY